MIKALKTCLYDLTAASLHGYVTHKAPEEIFGK
jgi:hypothetical protein